MKYVRVLLSGYLLGVLLIVSNCHDKEKPHIPIDFVTGTASVTEGDPATNVQLNLGSALGSAQQVTVHLSGTATLGTDYTITPAPDANGDVTVTIPANNAKPTILTLTPITDSVNEPDETIIFSLSNLPEGTVLGTHNPTFTVTIGNVAPRTIDFVATPATVTEGAATSNVQLTLSTPFSTAQQIKIHVGGTAAITNDFTVTPAPDANGDVTVSILPNTTNPTVLTLTTILDGVDDLDETVVFSLNNLSPGTVAGTQSPTYTVTIKNVPVINFDAATISVDEGTMYKAITLTTIQSLPANATITIQLEPIGNTVIGKGADADVETIPLPSSNTITVTGNGTKFQFLVMAFADSDTDTKGIKFTLTQVPTGFTIGDVKTQTLSITNNTLGDGLVGEYLFFGNADDTSGKNHHGTVTGAVPDTDRFGITQMAYHFAGVPNQYITIPNNADVNFASTQDFTVALWAKINNSQLDMGGSINNFIRQWQGDAQGYPFTLAYLNSSHPTNPGAIYCGRYGSSACGTGPGAISGAVTSDLHFIVFRKQGTDLSVYIDNTKAVSIVDTTVGCSTTNNSDLFIGCGAQTGAPTRCFSGTLDDIRMYNRALTTGEMGQLYTLQ